MRCQRNTNQQWIMEGQWRAGDVWRSQMAESRSDRVPKRVIQSKKKLFDCGPLRSRSIDNRNNPISITVAHCDSIDTALLCLSAVVGFRRSSHPIPFHSDVRPPSDIGNICTCYLSYLVVVGRSLQ